MFKTCIINLILPVLGFLVLNSLEAADKGIDGGYMTWFYAAAACQLLAAVLLLKGSAKLWNPGWVLLWLASACYMGGYSDLHIQDRVHTDVIGADSKLSNLNVRLAKLPADSPADDRTALALKISEARQDLEKGRLTYRTRYSDRQVPAEFRETFLVARDKLTALEYVMAILFLGAFFSVAAFSSLPAQRAYQLEGGSEEDPLNLETMVLDRS